MWETVKREWTWRAVKRSFQWMYIVFGTVVLVGMFLPGPDPEAERRRRLREAVAEAENERKGFHCLSSWDGDHNGLERLVRARLNDPDSLDTLGTYIASVNDAGKHPVRMEFTATNAFGGRVRNNAFGLIDNDTCEAELLSIG